MLYHHLVQTCALNDQMNTKLGSFQIAGLFDLVAQVAQFTDSWFLNTIIVESWLGDLERQFAGQ